MPSVIQIKKQPILNKLYKSIIICLYVNTERKIDLWYTAGQYFSSEVEACPASSVLSELCELPVASPLPLTLLLSADSKLIQMENCCEPSG